MLTKTHYFFWGGICSQWLKAPITIDGVTYNTNEQYMMWSKAALFNDEAAQRLIMHHKDPRDQKAVGRQVRNFDPAKWNEISRLVVYRANLAKFSQHKNLWEELCSYGDVKIVEASPEDFIWGIGLHETDPRCLDEAQWQGTNWLGEAIMQVRSDLLLLKGYTSVHEVGNE